jgi:hypothetical protein
MVPFLDKPYTVISLYSKIITYMTKYVRNNTTSCTVSLKNFEKHREEVHRKMEKRVSIISL